LPYNQTRMNTILWIIQSVTALVFLYSGINKSIYPVQRLVAAGQTGVAGLPASLIRFIGIIEIIMVLAARIHYRMQEPKNVLTNVILFALCIFIAWGRW